MRSFLGITRTETKSSIKIFLRKRQQKILPTVDSIKGSPLPTHYSL